MQLAPQFDDFLRQLGPFEPAPVLAVALSGGADSMALALLAADWAAARGGRIVALTVDHRLRPESTAEAQQVARWMAARGIAHEILTPMHTPAGNNLMQAARQWRYRALADWCREHHVLHCLVAHHQGDQLETALLHTARGDTEDGAAGMSAIRLYRGVRFLRPLLALPKAALVEQLRAAAMPWVEDPTNANPEFARTQARASLAGADPAQALQQHGAAATARMARERAAAEAAMRCVQLHPAGHAALRMGAWKALEPTLRSQLLADLVATIGGQIHRPRQHETAWLERAMQQARGKQTLGGCLIEWSLEEALVAREPARCEPPVTLRGRGQLLWDRRFRVAFDLEQPLTLGMLGEQGRKQLGQPLPLATPALWHLDRLHSVPHIEWNAAEMLPRARFRLGFAPAKPLAASSFWWFTYQE